MYVHALKYGYSFTQTVIGAIFLTIYSADILIE